MKFILPFILLSSFAFSSVRDDLKKYQGTEKYKEHEKAVIAAGKMIARLPRNMEGEWAPKEIAIILDLLRIETDAVYRQQMITYAVVNFQDNRKTISQAIEKDKKLSVQEKKDLVYDIDAMINQKERGQDSRSSKRN